MGPLNVKAVRFIAFLLGCTGLTMSMLACSKEPPDSQKPSDSQAGVEATIRQEDAAWHKAVSDRQLDTTLSYYGDGALFLAPNAPMARTKDEIRQTTMQFFTSTPPGATFSTEVLKVEVARSGDLAWCTGTYTFANPALDKGKYVDVWKKQADGSWKVVITTFNSDLPGPAGRPPAG
jgi:ketosteroid isomerase-like protein